MQKRDPKARLAAFQKTKDKALSTGGNVDKITREWETFFKPEGINFKLNDPLHKNDFDLSFCLPYGFWKDCTVIFNIKITKDYPMDKPEIKVKNYEVSKERREKGIIITEQRQEVKVRKPKFLMNWSLENNLTDIAFGLRDLLHKKSFVLNNISYQVMIPSQLSSIAGSITQILSLSLTSPLSKKSLSPSSSFASPPSSSSPSSSLPFIKKVSVSPNTSLTKLTFSSSKEAEESKENKEENREEKQEEIIPTKVDSSDESSSEDDSPPPPPAKEKKKLAPPGSRLISSSSMNLRQMMNNN